MGKPIKPEHVFPIAKKWWERKRPVGWTLEQHLSAPTVNCNVEDCKLANIIAGVIIARRKGTNR